MNAIEKSLSDYFEERKDRYAFVLLFGSAARGESHTLSDLDLGVYLHTPEDLAALGYDIAQLEGLVPRPVDVTPLNDLYRKDPLFAMEILKDHIPLMVNDQRAYLRFRHLTQLYYLDHLPLFELNRRQLQRRIDEGRIGERNYA